MKGEEEKEKAEETADWYSRQDSELNGISIAFLFKWGMLTLQFSLLFGSMATKNYTHLHCAHFVADSALDFKLKTRI